MSHPFWPLFDLEVRTPRMTLRYIDDELSVELATLAAGGVHDPAWMPFAVPWTDAEPPELQRSALQYHWRAKAETSPDSWIITFAALVDGVVVGATSLEANRFPTLRTFGSGSWLGGDYQGQGLGKEMRLATITVGFDGLGADEATTAAYEDNAASRGVTESLGYEPNGNARAMRRDRADVHIHYRMSRAHFDTIRRDDIEITGVEPVRELLGLT